MPNFRYQATDADGHDQTGRITARDLADARRQLVARGWQVRDLVSDEGAVDQIPRLSASDAEEIAAQVAEIGKANIPLAIGLRAAAAESVNRRVRLAFTELAKAIDQGQTLEQALAAGAGRFPAHVGGLVAAATRTAKLGGALEELLDHHRRMREIRWTVLASVAYPLLVIGLAAIVFLFLMLEIVPTFGQMFREFELELPAPTLGLIRISDSCVAMTSGSQKWLWSSALVMTCVALGLVRLVAGAGGWRRFLATSPLLGPIVTWSGAAAFSQMMAVLLDYQIPLDKALELTADAVRDGNVRDACRRMANGVADGQSMSHLLQHGRELPMTLVPFVRSGEEHGDLPGALQLAGQVFMERIGLRASLIRSISPPVIFVFIGVGIAYCVIALFMPLITLVVGLS